MVEFTSEAIWSWVVFCLFVCGKITNSIPFHIVICSNFLFFFESVLVVCVFLEIYHFIQVIYFVGIQLFILFSSYYFYFVRIWTPITVWCHLLSAWRTPFFFFRADLLAENSHGFYLLYVIFIFEAVSLAWDFWLPFIFLLSKISICHLIVL